MLEKQRDGLLPGGAIDWGHMVATGSHGRACIIVVLQRRCSAHLHRAWPAKFFYERIDFFVVSFSEAVGWSLFRSHSFSRFCW